MNLNIILYTFCICRCDTCVCTNCSRFK